MPESTLTSTANRRAPKPVMLIAVVILGLVLLAAGLAIGYIVGYNNFLSADKTPMQTPAAPPPAPVSETPAAQPGTIKTYKNPDYQNLTFKYDESVWNISETLSDSGDTITLVNKADMDKTMEFIAQKVSYGMYTGNVALYCGTDYKIIDNGTSSTVNETVTYYRAGLARVKPVIGSNKDEYIYGVNYQTAASYDWYYEYNKTVNIKSGACVDNFGAVGTVTDINPEIHAPTGTLTRALVVLKSDTNAQWSDAQLAAADSVAKSLEIGK